MKNNSTLNPLLEKVVNFDFNRFHTKKNRILLHALVWAIYFLLLGLSTFGFSAFGLKAAMYHTARIIICNIIVFYLLFYVVVPYVFKSKKVWIFIIAVILLLELWLVINHYYYYFSFNIFGIELESKFYQNLLLEQVNKPILQVISFRNLLSNTWDVVMALSPILFIKLIYELSKTYANSIKSNRKAEQLKHQNLLMENKFLQTQLSPHFFFNSLNNLYGLAMKKDDLTPEFILRFSEIMRYTLYETNAKLVPLQEELNIMKSYFEMEKMRFPKEFTIENEILVEKTQSLKIAPLLSFVFLENAFKYGLKSAEPFLKLSIEVQKKRAKFVIENDVKPGSSSSKKARGIGIKNAKRRLNLLYKDNYELDIKKTEKKFSVYLTVKLDKDEF